VQLRILPMHRPMATRRWRPGNGVSKLMPTGIGSCSLVTYYEVNERGSQQHRRPPAIAAATWKLSTRQMRSPARASCADRLPSSAHQEWDQRSAPLVLCCRGRAPHVSVTHESREKAANSLSDTSNDTPYGKA